MKFRTKKIIKKLYIMMFFFIVINMIIVSQTFSYTLPMGQNVTRPLTKFEATWLKLAVTFSQVAVSGYYVIKFTIEGIQYFVSVVAAEKANSRNAMKSTLFHAVIAFLVLYFISFLVGL